MKPVVRVLRLSAISSSGGDFAFACVAEGAHYVPHGVLVECATNCVVSEWPEPLLMTSCPVVDPSGSLVCFYEWRAKIGGHQRFITICTLPELTPVRTWPVEESVLDVVWLAQDIVCYTGTPVVPDSGRNGHGLFTLDTCTGHCHQLLSDGLSGRLWEAKGDVWYECDGPASRVWQGRSEAKGDVWYECDGACLASVVGGHSTTLRGVRVPDEVTAVSPDGYVLVMRVPKIPLIPLAMAPWSAAFRAALRGREAVPIRLDLFDVAVGNRIWKGPLRVTYSAAVSSGWIASCEREATGYAIYEYDLHGGGRRRLSVSPLPLRLVGRVASGWLALGSDDAAVLVSRDGVRKMVCGSC